MVLVVKMSPIQKAVVLEMLYFINIIKIPLHSLSCIFYTTLLRPGFDLSILRPVMVHIIFCDQIMMVVTNNFWNLFSQHILKCCSIWVMDFYDFYKAKSLSAKV